MRVDDARRDLPRDLFDRLHEIEQVHGVKPVVRKLAMERLRDPEEPVRADHLLV